MPCYRRTPSSSLPILIGVPMSNAAVTATPDPAAILQIGFGFWPAKTLLSAVELDLFTVLGEAPLTGAQIADRLGLGSRATYDFLDGPVALRLLERAGSGPDARYANTVDTAAFLDANSP